MKHALVAVVVAPWLLAGCVVTPTTPVDPAVDECGASELQYLVGKPGVLLDGMRFSQEVRVITPSMAVTMDYRAERLNFSLDNRDVIERVYCS